MDKKQAYHPVAADLDGTWTDHPEIHGEVDFIITGNNWDQYDSIIDEEGIDLPIFFNPDKEELQYIVKHKADIINRTGVGRYYEDQDVQAEMLKVLCPECRIVLVKEGQNSL